MANYLVHVPVSRIVDVFNALKLLGTAELYDYKLVTVRCDMDLDVLQKVVDAVKPDQPAIIVKVDDFVFQGDPKVEKAVGIWRRAEPASSASGF
jgi:hypothetical protein